MDDDDFDYEPDPDAQRDMLIDDGWTDKDILHRTFLDLEGRYLGAKDEVEIEAPPAFLVVGALSYDVATGLVTRRDLNQLLERSDGGQG